MRLFSDSSKNSHSPIYVILALIKFNSETVQCENLADMMHELSNLGARDEFTKLLKTLIIPKLVEASAVGDREIRLGSFLLI